MILQSAIKRNIKKFIKKTFNVFGLEIKRLGSSSSLYDRDLSDYRGMSNLLKTVVKIGFKPETVIDIGVAYGTPALYENFRNSHHLLIEPLKEWEGALKKICQEYNAEYVLAAVGAKAGVTTINIETILSDSTTYKVLSGIGKTITKREIPVFTVDKLLREKMAKAPYLIKIDVQGGELDVLDGAKEALENTELVIIEVSFFPVYENAPNCFDAIKYMKERGFVIYDVFDF